MNHCYQGITHNTNPIEVDRVDSTISGHYRGVNHHFHYPRHIPVPQATHQLHYRGLAYQATEDGVLESLPAFNHPRPSENLVAAMKTTPQSSMISARQAMLGEVTKVHQQNIYRSLEYRLTVARAKGDDALIHQLEHEMQQFA